MPQEHHVLRCISCETFQVHIVKKATKWECKICGTKQSVKRNYGRGSGKDCRNQVMKLNEIRMLKDKISEPNGDDEIFENVFTDELRSQEPKEVKSLNSKWTKYLEESSANEESKEEKTSNTMEEESFGSHKKRKAKNDKEYPTVAEVERDDSKKNPIETKWGVKRSKYAKYWDEDEESTNETQINKNSNTFNLGLVDSDNILNFS